MRTFRRCSLEHHYAYELGYRSLAESAESLRFGSLFHVGLEHWWRAYATPDRQLAAAFEAMRPLALDEYDWVRASVLMEAYDLRWGDEEDVEVLGVELEFRAEMRNPLTGAASRTFVLGGKLDALVLNRRDDRIYFVEHKTSGEDVGPGTRYWQRLLLDSQVSTYFAGTRALGYVDVAGCLYDVIGKPRHAPLKATPDEARKYTKAGALYANQRADDETPDEYRERLIEAITEAPDKYFQRELVVRLPEEQRDAAYDAWATARQIREAELAGIHVRNVASCERYGRLCPYFPVCTRTATLEDATLYERVANVHPELTPDQAEVDAAE